MNILEIIEKKRDKKKLTKDEIEYFIEGYTNDKIVDYQASALIMAIYLNGMTKQETTDMTIAMANSGEQLDLSKLNEIIVDKHSTGGVGDKVSLILLPLVASLGVPVAKMSGRGLGFTGGTVDKLESIPGYQTGIDIHNFVENVEKVGISMISQTLNLAPADKKIYSLRDSISCVESIPLNASSIIRKKIASGAQKIVLDVTCGSGAFMQSKERAEELANEMIEIGKLANRETVCILTNMDEPLGHAVGNSLEVIEAIQSLKGEMPEDVKEVIKLVKELRGKYPIFGICLGHQMISLAYGAKTYKLKFGHRGGNHPVLNLETDKIEITSQNHSYAVDEKSLEKTDLVPTHKNILDNTIEGVECKKDKVFSVQYHPESAPGPQDSGYLFDKFIQNLEEFER